MKTDNDMELILFEETVKRYNFNLDTEDEDSVPKPLKKLKYTDMKQLEGA